MRSLLFRYVLCQVLGQGQGILDPGSAAAPYVVLPQDLAEVMELPMSLLDEDKDDDEHERIPSPSSDGGVKRAIGESAEWCTKSRRTSSTASSSGNVADAPGAASMAAAAAPTAAAAPKASFEIQHKKRVAAAEAQVRHWWREVERERMQLAAHIAGKARQESLQAPDLYGPGGRVVGYLDPYPDIDRLHVKVWPIGTAFLDARYICFLGALYMEPIATLKAKIQDHPDGISATDMKVFFRGRSLSDTDTLAGHGIDDDHILHACGSHETVVAKASEQFYQWRLLLPDRLPTSGTVILPTGRRSA